MIVKHPTTVYGSRASVASSVSADSRLNLPSPLDILFHDGSQMSFRDDSVVAFHDYVIPESSRKFSAPRTVYSGGVE